MPPSNQSRGGLSVWWVVSIIFHALLLGWLLCFSPVKVIGLSKPSPNGGVSQARAREIVSKISEQQAENLSASVRELQDMRQQLAELEARKREEYQKFAADLTKESPVQAEQAQAEAVQAQAEALAAQAKADSVISNALQTRGETEVQQLNDFQKTSAAAQTRATEAQQRALDKLAVSDRRFSEAYRLQAEAKAAQERAAAAQAAARVTRGEAESSKGRERGAQLNTISNALAQAEKDLAFATTDLVALSNNLAAVQMVAVQSDTNSATGLRAFTQAVKQVDSIQKKIANRQSQSTKYAGRIVEQKGRLEKALAEAARDPAVANNEQLVRLQGQARLRQVEAQQAQRQALDQFAAAKRQPAPAHAGVAALPAMPAPVSEPAVPAGQAKKMDLPALYDKAVQTEAALAESYRRLRATELAMIRQVPLAQALELTDSAKVARPQLHEALTETTNMAVAREAMQSARAEIGAIHQLASSLLAQAREMSHSGSRSATGASASSESLDTAIDRSRTLASLAAEDENMRAKDLTAAMRHIQGGAGKSSGGGGKKSSSGGAAGKSGSGSGGHGSGSGAVGGGSGGGVGGTGNGSGAGGAGGGGDGGTGGGSGGSGAGGNGSGIGGDGTSSGSVPGEVGGSIPAMPGRTVAAQGESARWMFVDSWYILGPFDNAGRMNIEKQFPPETIVDRSAVYNGKGGSRLRWEFHQAHEAKVAPPFRTYNAGGRRDLQYIIYYAATELYFEKECDLWVAIGSDDFSKVWVNDQLIWSSGKQQKKWRVDEGLRKVHFNQGVNRVLYRVENGHGQTEFSLVLGMP